MLSRIHLWRVSKHNVTQIKKIKNKKKEMTQFLGHFLLPIHEEHVQICFE